MGDSRMQCGAAGVVGVEPDGGMGGVGAVGVGAVVVAGRAIDGETALAAGGAFEQLSVIVGGRNRIGKTMCRRKRS